MQLSFSLQSVAIAAPGLDSWEQAQTVLCGQTPYQNTETIPPVANVLSPRERRRASRTVNLALAVATAAQQTSAIAADQLRKIFVSSNGDIDIFHYLCEELAVPEPQISPTKFHQSLHNSVAGYWDIVTHSHTASTSISAQDYGFVSGFLEAGLQAILEQQPVLLVFYDLNPTAPMDVCNPVWQWIGIGLVITPQPQANALANIKLCIEESPSAITSMNNITLEKFRQQNPAALGLPLLQALAKRNDTTVIFDYFTPQKMILHLSFGAQHATI